MIIIAAIFLSKRYRKLTAGKRQSFGLYICWTVFALEMGKYAYLLIIKEFDMEVLPLHLCGMAIYISLLNAYHPGKIKQELLYSLCMPGALSALLFPAWSAYPVISLICIQNFIQHGLLMIYPIMLFSGRDIKPDYRNLPKCLLFLAVISPPIYLFNKVLDTNFLFINHPSPGSPLVLFDKWFGNPGYILGILMLILIVWAFLYLPIIIKNGKKTI